jgi:hypothetical protein
MKSDAEVVIKILMRRDGLNREEAEQLLDECRAMVDDGEDPEEVLYLDLGLEPDYVFALI